MSSNPITRFFAFFAICIAALHAAIPSGYMVDRNDAGKIIIEVCGGGHDDRTAVLDLKTGEISSPEKDDADPESDESCDIRAATHWTHALKVESVKAPITSNTYLTIDHADTTVLYSSAPPLPARGPPLLQHV